MKEFILTRKLKDYSEFYWRAVVEGIVILLKYRDSGLLEEDLKTMYEKLRIEISEMDLSNIVYDFSDELSAILLGSYPQPNFWTATIDDYKKHPNFGSFF